MDNTQAIPARVKVVMGLWLGGGGLVAVLGALMIALSVRSITAWVGAGYVVIGLAIIMMAFPAYRGDARWRRALAMLTLVVTLASMIVALFLGAPLELLAALVALCGSLVSYRPGADDYFVEP